MRKLICSLLIIYLIAMPTPSSGAYQLSMFYCGFSGNFCGQSSGDDVNPGATTIILAFANTQNDGKIIVDEANWPTNQINSWKSQG